MTMPRSPPLHRLPLGVDGALLGCALEVRHHGLAAHKQLGAVCLAQLLCGAGAAVPQTLRDAVHHIGRRAAAEGLRASRHGRRMAHATGRRRRRPQHATMALHVVRGVMCSEVAASGAAMWQVKGPTGSPAPPDADADCSHMLMGYL